MFYETVVCSVLTFALVCWGENAIERDMGRLNKLIKRAGSSVGSKLEPLGSILERRRLQKGVKIEGDELHPLHSMLMKYKSRRVIRQKYILPSISTDRFGNSFFPEIMRALNEKK